LITAEALQIKERLTIESGRGLEDSLQIAALSDAQRSTSVTRRASDEVAERTGESKLAAK
jgi:hypothetical protein